jgi:2-(1,2-epoxy-1,2-dihydrophenyl)acetyl-CoA isomerase
MHAAVEVDENPQIRCVVITGAGDFFCVGGDVATFSKTGDQVSKVVREITVYMNGAISRLCRMNKPLITSINGPTAGVGLAFALFGDLVIASDAAVFTTAYSKIGLSPDGGVSWILPRVVGLRTAQELAITSRMVGAEEAKALGMVTEIVPHADLAARTHAVAKQLSSGSPAALGSLRRLFLSSYSNTLETHLELEARDLCMNVASPEARALSEQFAASRGK